ncbi:unnamed protein product [Chrysoparadoxa australica]
MVEPAHEGHSSPSSYPVLSPLPSPYNGSPATSISPRKGKRRRARPEPVSDEYSFSELVIELSRDCGLQLGLDPVCDEHLSQSLILGQEISCDSDDDGMEEEERALESSMNEISATLRRASRDDMVHTLLPQGLLLPPDAAGDAAAAAESPDLTMLVKGSGERNGGGDSDSGMSYHSADTGGGAPHSCSGSLSGSGRSMLGGYSGGGRGKGSRLGGSVGASSPAGSLNGNSAACREAVSPLQRGALTPPGRATASASASPARAAGEWPSPRLSASPPICGRSRPKPRLAHIKRGRGSNGAGSPLPDDGSHGGIGAQRVKGSSHRCGRKPLKEVIEFDLTHLPDFNACIVGDLLTPYMLQQVYSGLIPWNTEPACTFMLECCMRPDVSSSSITQCVSRVCVESGLDVTRRRGRQLLCMVPMGSNTGAIDWGPIVSESGGGLSNSSSRRDSSSGSGAGWGPWEFVDAQLTVSRATKNRVLLVRFLVASGSTKYPVAASGTIACLALPSVSFFLKRLKSELISDGLSNGCLTSVQPAGKELHGKLDSSFIRQIEEMCQGEMYASLEQTGKYLEDHAQQVELSANRAMKLLNPMFDIYKTPIPMLALPLPAPDGLSGAMFRSTNSQLTESDIADLEAKEFKSEADRQHAEVLGRWCRYVAHCDAEMTVRMQEKNKQVMQRIVKTKVEQLELFQLLRDSYATTRAQSIGLVQSFHQAIEDAGHAGLGTSGYDTVDIDVEVPIFYCSCTSSASPGFLYLTYWHLCWLPKFTKRILIVSLNSIVSVSRRKGAGFLGLSSAVDVEYSVNQALGEDEQCQRLVLSLKPTITDANDLRDLIEAVSAVHTDPGCAIVPDTLEWVMNECQSGASSPRPNAARALQGSKPSTN